MVQPLYFLLHLFAAAFLPHPIHIFVNNGCAPSASPDCYDSDKPGDWYSFLPSFFFFFLLFFPSFLPTNTPLCVCANLTYIFVYVKDWMDSKLNWDPDEYGGVEQLIVPSEHIWLPDILLYNKYLCPAIYQIWKFHIISVLACLRHD